MKRRSFLSVAVGLLAAPFACLRKSKAEARVLDTIGGYEFHPPLKRIDIDWYREEQELPETREPGGIAFWLCPSCVHVRYRINDGEWQEKEGPSPLELCEDVSFMLTLGTVAIVWGQPYGTYHRKIEMTRGSQREPRHETT